MNTSKQNATSWKRTIALLLLCTMLFCVVSCGKDGEKSTDGESGEAFDYENCEFEEYFTLDEKVYRDQTIEAPYPQYITEKDIDEAIEDALASNGTPKYVTDRAAAKGDTVKIYYRGVTTDKNGVETAFDGGTHMTFGKAYSLTLGSGQFIDGFEEGLIGVIPQNTYRFVSDDENLTVAGDSVIHVTYEATYDEKGTAKTKKGTNILENLLDKTFGDEFATALLGAKAGEVRTFDTTYDVNGDKTKDTVAMTVTVVDIAVMNPCTVSATFPTSYPNSPDLAGKTVKFYVWVESIEETVPAELNEKFITETMKVEVKDGEDAVTVFREYVRNNLQKQREQNVRSVTVSEAWKNLLEKAVFTKLPEDEVKACYEYEMETLESYFSYYGASLGCNTVEDFAPFYFGVSEDGFDLEKYVTEISENAIKRELIFNYLCQTHELGADEQTIAEEVEKLFQEEADYANAQNPNAGYTAESVRKELEAQYGEGYFEKYVASNLNSERVDDFLFDNYTVIFAEESTEAK